jgi:hypothetical protein
MRAIVRLVTAALVFPLAAAAQNAAPATQSPEPEIGFRAGISRVTEPGGSGFPDQTLTVITVPSTSLFFANGIFATFFLSPRVAIQPQFGLLRQSDDNSSSTLTFLAFQPELFFNPGGTGGYAFGQVGVLRSSSSFDGGGSDSENNTTFGVGIGYRSVIRRSLALRYEARLRRLNDADGGDPLTEIGLMLGVAAVIPRRAP